MNDGYTCNDCGHYHFGYSDLRHYSDDSGGFCANCDCPSLTPDSEQDIDHYLSVMKPGIAVLIAEGVETPRSENEFIAAWQYLHDSGMAYKNLQGWFGRRCQDMISQGIIDP